MHRHEKIIRDLGRRIRRVRRKQSLTQVELSAAMGMSRATIATVETGRINVPLLTIVRIADGLGVSVRSLMPKSAREIVNAECRSKCERITALKRELQELRKEKL